MYTKNWSIFEPKGQSYKITKATDLSKIMPPQKHKSKVQLVYYWCADVCNMLNDLLKRPCFFPSKDRKGVVS